MRASRIKNHYNENFNDNEKKNRTLIVGPPVCGRTHLVLNKLQLIRLDNPEQKKTYHYEDS